MRAIRFIATTFFGCALTAAWPAETEAQRLVGRALANAGSIPAQAETLARLAWPDHGVPDSEVAALARAQLVGFGAHGMAALRASIRRTERVYTGDVASALLESQLRVTGGVPPTYVPALEELVWFGSVEAQRLVIPELARRRYGPAMMATIDAACDHPELVETLVRALPEFRDQRARFYLGELLESGEHVDRRFVADTMVRIGGQALEILREQALSDDAEIRQVSIHALLPSTGIDDLTTLHEYVALHPDDQPELLDRIRKRAIDLEILLEEEQSRESASSDPS